jgi:hypothetical protein
MKALGKGSVASVVKVGLDVVWVLLWIAAITLGVTALASLGLGLLRDTLDAGPLGMDGALEINIAGIEVKGVGAEMLGWPLQVTALLAGAVAIAASLIIVDRLRRLFLKFTSDAPFDADNARHLRVIWITMAAAELSRYVIMAIIAGLLLNFGRPEGVSVAIEPDINLSTWAAILILVVLAEVFAQGARMREEQDLTI